MTTSRRRRHHAGYDAVNLIDFVDRLEGDLLSIHGTGDDKQFDMMVYPNEHHGIEGARLHA